MTMSIHPVLHRVTDRIPEPWGGAARTHAAPLHDRFAFAKEEL
jgi:hypothetical protein